MAQTTLLSRGCFVVGAKRTPFGAFGGKLKALAAVGTGDLASKIDSVVFGNVAQTSNDAIYQARHIGLRSGLRVEVPALTVNRLCGSGFQAVATAAMEVEMSGAGMV